MHVPAHFHVTDLDEQLSFMRNHPFGILISSSGNLEPTATHLPFLIKTNDQKELYLEGHLAAASPHAGILRNGRSALAVFNGPHAYISSSVYEKSDAPTWNYMTVHAYGTVNLLSKEELVTHLEELVETNEGTEGKVFRISDLTQNQLAHYLEHIHGFRLKIYKTECSFKLSQNRSEKDIDAVIAYLENNPENTRIVQQMKKFNKR